MVKLVVYQKLTGPQDLGDRYFKFIDTEKLYWSHNLILLFFWNDKDVFMVWPDKSLYKTACMSNAGHVVLQLQVY